MTNTSSPFTTHTASGRAVETDLRRALVAMQVVMAELDPAAIPLPDVTAVFTLFADVRRLAGNGQTLMAGRVKEAREWARSGHATVEDWIANTTGSSVGAAKDQVRTSERLDRLPDTTEQMRTGGVSPEQADIVADAAAVNPASEGDLLERARRDSNKALRDEAARRKAQARGESANEKAQRHRAERSARFYNDRDGRRCLYAQGTAADLAALEAAIDRAVDRRYRDTGSTGRREGRDRYAFDALTALADSGTGDPKRVQPKHLTLIRVDLAALVRGTVDEGEVCEIAGVGPISVDEARQLLGDSILHLVSENGVDVQNVTHLGRGPNAVQQVALLWRTRQCTVMGCNRTHTENDHRVEFADTRHTRVDEIDPMCDHHHDLKTYRDWVLVPGTGRREMIGPHDPRHPRHQAGSSTVVTFGPADEAPPRTVSTDQGELFDTG